MLLLFIAQVSIEGLDYFLGFSACSSLQPVKFCTCKNGDVVDKTWFEDRGLAELTKEEMSK